jgi:hypothetical protein
MRTIESSNLKESMSVEVVACPTLGAVFIAHGRDAMISDSQSLAQTARFSFRVGHTLRF